MLRTLKLFKTVLCGSGFSSLAHASLILTFVALVSAGASATLASAQTPPMSGEQRPLAGVADRISRLQIDSDSMGLAEPMHVDELLPPRRPTSAQITAMRERSRNAPSIRIAQDQRPQDSRPAESVRPLIRNNGLCASARCPHSNMIGIQY